MNDPEAALIAEQMHHALDLMRAEIDTLKARQLHDRELLDHRLAGLEARSSDHEKRIREATQGVTQFKVWSGLTSGSSTLMSLAALVKAFFGV